MSLKIKKIEFFTKKVIFSKKIIPQGSFCEEKLNIKFYNMKRSQMPDIDFDVSEPMKLKEQFIEEWGNDYVVPISNWNTLQLRSLIKDISKLYNIPFKEVNNVTSVMLQESIPQAKKKNNITSGVYNPTFEEVMDYSETLQLFLEKYPFVKTHIDVLKGMRRSISRHAGGIICGENLTSCIPLINSGGVIQSPWSEGQNVRHLEPMGFIKFDILGLASLRMIENSIIHVLKRHFNKEKPTFEDVKEFYNEYLHPNVIDFNDQYVYENVFHNGKWMGIFQFTETGAQRFCMKCKPRSLNEMSNITAIYRPATLSSNVDKMYLEAKENPEFIKYIHPKVKEVLGMNYGFIIYQEDLANLAYKLGKNISLDEGNKLRKLLVKKGIGSIEKEKKKIYNKFIEGCLEKGIKEKEGDELWKKMEYFSGYGFNKSHSVSYCMLSFQCAWMLTYYPSEWCAAFLDKEPEEKKEKAINLVKQHGFMVEPVNINFSSDMWEISKDGKTFYQPLSSIKGMGNAAIEQIINNRHFNKIEDLLFNENIKYNKLNKKSLDVLLRSGALKDLLDERFNHSRHLWCCVTFDYKKSRDKFLEGIEAFRDERDFTKEEEIENLIELTGIFPCDKIIDNELKKKLFTSGIMPISEYDRDLKLCWFIPREVIVKKTKKGKEYYFLNVIDDNNIMTRIRIWSFKKGDVIEKNRPYIGNLDYSDEWGFSARTFQGNFRVIG